MDGVIEQASQRDLPAGRTFSCMECGTRLRIGQPHTALAPKPHQTLSMAIIGSETLGPIRPARPSVRYPGKWLEAVDVREDFHADHDTLRGYVRGSHGGVTGWKPLLRHVTGTMSSESSESSYYNWASGRKALRRQGRLLSKGIEQRPDGTWQEVV
jgi:hypothetical protein